jgi:hypothetical protein
MKRAGLMALLLATEVACDGLPTSVSDTDTDSEDSDTTPATSTGWTEHTHPCFGNRTDALWGDDDSTWWVGCGTTTTGTGLFYTTDGGSTWKEPQTDPNGWFEPFRVVDIFRGDDDLLYVAGTNTVGSERVLSLDTSVAPFEVAEVWTAGTTAGTSFTVGTFRRTADGAAVAESLTGVDLMYRASDSADFVDYGDWPTDGESYQMLDLTEFGVSFYGCGSTIAHPPMAFLPNRDTDATGFSLEPVKLSGDGLDDFNGETYGIDVDSSGIVIVGVNQNRNVGMVYSTITIAGDDIYTSSGWTQFDVSTLIDSSSSWMRGVCRDGDIVVAVGEKQNGASGLVIQSTDGGVTFEDVTPSGAGPVHECQFVNGTLGVAGSGGYFAVQ